MHNGVWKGMMGIVLSAVLLFSNLFSIRSEALPADSISVNDFADGNEARVEEETIISQEWELEEESETEDQEAETEEETSWETETETEDKSEEETEEEITLGSEDGEKENDIEGVESSMSGNMVSEDEISILADGNEVLEEASDTDIGEIVGDSIPVIPVGARGILPYTYLQDDSDHGYDSRYILSSQEQGEQLTSETDLGQDWAYALCSALESNLKKKFGKEVSIDREELVSYLYSASNDKEKIIDKAYGDIANDIIIDPEKGSEKAGRTGNVHTAMWAVASGYALKAINEPEQKYRLNNIYLYHGREINKIKYAIMTRGEVVTSLYRAQNCFQENIEATDYKLSYHCPNTEFSSDEYQHTVSIVGWDDDYSYGSFPYPEEGWGEDAPANGAWLVKDAYGYNGEYYYWVSYYEDVLYNKDAKICCYSFELTIDSENTHTYQYDGGGSYYRYGTDNYAKAVNIFPKAGMNEILEAVSFGTNTYNAQYRIQIYLNAKPVGEGNSQPVLEECLFEEPIILEDFVQAGYYTVDLEQYADKYCREYADDPRLSIRDKEAYFAVEIEIISEKEIPRFWIDGANASGVLPECAQDGTAVGQSYVWKDGKWVDFGQDMAEWGKFSKGQGSNIRIKAHTEDRIALEAFRGEKVCHEVWVGEILTLQTSIGGVPVGAGETLEWISDNPEIATVSKNGTIVPKTPGYVNITVTSEKYGSDTIEIMVKDVSCTEHLLLCSNSINMEKRKGQIVCTFYPSGYGIDHIEYEVRQEDKDYLWVDENGLVTVREAAESRGNIPISVKIYEDKDNFIMKEVTVSCYQVPEKFEIVNEAQEIQDSVEIKVFEELQLGVRIIEPEDAVTSDIKWKSSNPAVVSVSSQGKLYALKEGTAVIAAVSSDDPDNQKQIKVTVKAGVSSVAFSESYITLLPNESKELVVNVLPKNIQDPKIEWIMTDWEGNELGLRNGSVSFDPDTRILTAGSESMPVTKLKLYAVCDGVKSSCFIKVDIPVRDLKLSFSDDSIVTEQTVKTSMHDQALDPVMLYCHFEPETLSAEDVILFFSSDDPEVAKVSKDGNIIPLKVGSVNLTAGTEHGISAKVHLTIQSIYADQTLSLYSDENKIYVGGVEPETTLLTVMTGDGTPAPAEDFYWKVSDESIAVVDDAGIVKAVSKGKVTITATDRLNPVKQVRKEIQVGIGVCEIQTKRDHIEIAVGKEVTLACNVLPLDADEKTVTLYTEDEGIARCYGKTIYALKEGKTTVYIEAENGIRKEVTVQVREQGASRIEASLTRDDIGIGYITTSGTKESQAQIKAVALDGYGNAEGISQIFDFYSEDPDIVQIDDCGYVTGGSEGETRIRVSASDGSGVRTYVTVMVQKADSGIKSVTLNHSKVELGKGDKLELIAALLPENASGIQAVVWQSMDETIATVDPNGVVLTQGYGKTNIVAQSLDGKKSASCEIRVLPMDSQIKLLKIEDQVLENKIVNPSSGYQISVYANDGKDYRTYCEFTSSNENVCTVDENGLVVPSGQESTGTSTITVKVKDDLLGRKISFKVKLTDEKQAADIRIYANLSTGKREIGAELPLYLPSEIGNEIGLEGFAIDRNGSFMEESSLIWSVSDKKVITVKELKSGKTSLAIKGNGSCILTCSVRNQTKISVSIPVYIYDGKPVLTEKSLSVNLLKTESIFIPLQMCIGTEMEEMQIAYIKNGKKYLNEGFAITVDENASGQYVLNYDAESLGKGNYVIYVKAVIRFDDSKEGRILKEIYHNQDKKIEMIEIPIKVTSQQPKVKIKLSTLNVFEKNAKQELEIVTEEEIDRIELLDGKSTGIEEKFILRQERGSFWISALTEKKGSFNAVLQVYLKDYTDPISVKCTIKTAVNKPKLKASPEKLFVYKQKDETADFSFSIFDSSTNEYISQEGGYVISGGTLENDQITVSGLDSFGKKTIQILVKNETLWNEDILLKVPVTIEDESKITLETSQNKVTLNKRLNSDCAEISVYMKQQNIPISKIEDIVIYDAKSKPSRDFNVTWGSKENGEQFIEFRTMDSCEKGKYKAEITVQAALYAADGSTNMKTYKKSITLVVEDVSPTVKVKLKGNIDLYNRAETYMTGTVAVSHAANKVVDITSEREDFMVIYDEEQEQFMLSLKQNHMISKKKQTVILRITLSDGTELKKAVNINLRQSSVKWKKQDTAVIYKSVGNRKAVIPFETETPKDADLKITILSLPRGMSVDTDHDQISVFVDEESLKAGKYKIKTTIRILDSDGLTPMASSVIKKEVVVQIK